MLQTLKNAANLSDVDTVWLDKLLHGSLDQLWQVPIDFIHAHVIQLVEAAATRYIRMQDMHHKSSFLCFCYILRAA